jgi:y4mF family transcriptional regulator
VPEHTLPEREEMLLKVYSTYVIFPLGKNGMIDNATQFGEAVASARKALGLTQRELALAINSGERFIVDLEAGKPTAQLGKALAAAKAVGLRLTATGISQA